MTFKKATKGKVGMTVIYSGDSSVRIKKDGTLAWRNNNPGNIKCDKGNFAKRHGSIGCDGRFAIFPDRRTGEKAQETLLKGKNYQNSSIDQAIKTYAPRKDNNDTEKYIQYINKKTGLSRDKKVGNMTSHEFDKFIGSIRSYERTTPGTEVTLPCRGYGLQDSEGKDCRFFHLPRAEEIRTCLAMSSLIPAGAVS